MQILAKKKIERGFTMKRYVPGFFLLILIILYCIGCGHKKEIKAVYKQRFCPRPLISATTTSSCEIQPERLGIIYFDTDKYEIKPIYHTLLDNVVSILSKYPDMELEVQGHTDNVASSDYNNVLSENRAKAVFNYLIAKGIKADRMIMTWLGLAQPKVANIGQHGKSINRRVELVARGVCNKKL